jgi:SlyX protein
MSSQDLSEEVEERFQVLESKASHTSYTVDELNSVVIRQQDQIDALVAEVKRLRDIIMDGGDRTIDAGEEPPPPHY